jgi:hypothetical protein
MHAKQMMNGINCLYSNPASHLVITYQWYLTDDSELHIQVHDAKIKLLWIANNCICSENVSFGIHIVYLSQNFESTSPIYQFGLRYLLKGLGPCRFGSSGSGIAADPKNNNNNLIPIHYQMW